MVGKATYLLWNGYWLFNEEDCMAGLQTYSARRLDPMKKKIFNRESDTLDKSFYWKSYVL